VSAASWKLLAKVDSGLIYIKPDGSIDPAAVPIEQVGDLYRLTGNITGRIFVQRDNISIDGNGWWIEGDTSGYGFDLTGRSNITITNCTIRNFWVGIHVYSSSEVFLKNNRFEQNGDGGIHILSSDGNCVIESNTFTENGGSAIWLVSSTDGNISGNLVTNNYAGISLVASSTIMRNNNMTGNRYNFAVDGQQLSHFMNDIDTSNTINNKPIYYWVNKQGMEIPLDAGFVAVINSTNITVKNLTLANNYEGVLSCFTSNLTIQNVSLFYNHYGIVLFESSNNNVTNCDTETGYYGILLQDSSNNSITRSRIANNQYGIKLVRSSDNQIYHNNFLNNVKQADTDAESISAWDNGYPSGGNYWSDYTGVDLNSGPYQNVTGSDGIGDTPYTINVVNEDDYPLIPEQFTLIALLSFMIVSTLIIVYAKKKSVGTKSPSMPAKKCAAERL